MDGANWEPKYLSEAEQLETAERMKMLVRESMAPVSILCSTWREIIGGADVLELDLSNGSVLHVGWDRQYGCRVLRLDGEPCTGAETGLRVDVLGVLVDAVYERMCDDLAEVES